MKWTTKASAVILALLSTLPALAVQPAGIFGNHMVLQRDIEIPVWGVAEPDEAVVVQLGEAKVTGKAGPDGRWLVRLPAQKAGGPVELKVGGKTSVTFTDVLIGDVWICSGQSNAEMALGGCNAPEDVASANFPMIRRVKIAHRVAAVPQAELPPCSWQVAASNTAAGFTAIGFYFAREIHKETGIPIGLIDDNWGGTRIEPWMAPEGIAAMPALAPLTQALKRQMGEYRKAIVPLLDETDAWVKDARAAVAENRDIAAPPVLPKHPAANETALHGIYHAMVRPMVPFAIKGALWYQGESNGGEGPEYTDKMEGLIKGWRQVWGQGDFPFYFVQLASFAQPTQDPTGADGWARIRCAQTASLRIPNTGMAVAIDVGEAADIHPKNKFDVGRRLALWALSRDYGKKDLVVSGPLYRDMKIDGGRIQISFDHIGSGLMVGKKDGRKPAVEDPDNSLKRFAVAGEDKKWFWAEAEIDVDGSTVTVSAEPVPSPVAVRYGFSMNPTGCNLYNREGLPASPFRTDSW